MYGVQAWEALTRCQEVSLASVWPRSHLICEPRTQGIIREVDRIGKEGAVLVIPLTRIRFPLPLLFSGTDFAPVREGPACRRATAVSALAVLSPAWRASRSRRSRAKALTLRGCAYTNIILRRWKTKHFLSRCSLTRGVHGPSFAMAHKVAFIRHDPDPRAVLPFPHPRGEGTKHLPQRGGVGKEVSHELGPDRRAMAAIPRSGARAMRALDRRRTRCHRGQPQ